MKDVKIIDDSFFETPKTQDELYELVKKEAGKNEEMIWPMWKAVMWTQNLINYHNWEVANRKGEEA
tara:strand:+ start:2246 stop:2443 length:198 start_codon:yes stop_codon:yes gene_type:complete